MSFKRDTAFDLQRTREVLADGSRIDQDDASKNWLDHRLGDGGAKIDEMLLEGATRAQLAEARGAVDEHLRHLRIEHGLPIAEHDGKFMFDRQAIDAVKPARTSQSRTAPPPDKPLSREKLSPRTVQRVENAVEQSSPATDRSSGVVGHRLTPKPILESLGALATLIGAIAALISAIAYLIWGSR